MVVVVVVVVVVVAVVAVVVVVVVEVEERIRAEVRRGSEEARYLVGLGIREAI